MVPETLTSVLPTLLGAVNRNVLVQVVPAVMEDPQVPPLAAMLPDDTVGENDTLVIEVGKLFLTAYLNV
jgi:hypothetical protein